MLSLYVYFIILVFRIANLWNNMVGEEAELIY